MLRFLPKKALILQPNPNPNMKKIILKDSQLNELVVQVTNRLLEHHVFPEESISGKEILNFCPHKQVNSFVLFQIFQEWESHLKKINHPYFDFNAPEVKEAMKPFTNVLSNHIRVPRADFHKMLKQAVYNTLKLILNPEDAIGNFFFKNSESIPLQLYQKHAPYFKNYEFVIKSLQKYLEKNQVRKVEKKAFFEKFEKVVGIFEKKENRPIFTYQKELFSALTEEDLDQLLAREISNESKAEKPSAGSLPVADRVQEEQAKHRKVESNKEKTVSEKFQEEKSKSINERFAKSESTTLVDQAQTKPNPTEEEKPRRKVASLFQVTRSEAKERKESHQEKEIPGPAVEAEDPPRKEEPPQKRVNLFAQKKQQESKMQEKRTLGEELSEKHSGTNVNDTLAQKAIQTEQIPVHKQFQFVQKVFGGSSVKFKVVLDKINKTENLEEAESVLNRYVFNDPNINRNDKVCKEFEGLVKGRFE